MGSRLDLKIYVLDDAALIQCLRKPVCAMDIAVISDGRHRMILNVNPRRKDAVLLIKVERKPAGGAIFEPIRAFEASMHVCGVNTIADLVSVMVKIFNMFADK